MLVLPNVEFVNEIYQIDLQIEVVKASYCQLMLCSCSVNILSRWWLHNDMTMSSIRTVYTVCTSGAGEGVPPASIWQLIFEHPHDRNGYYLALDRTASCSVEASTIAWWRRRRSHEEDSWWITSQRRAGGPWCRACCVLLTTLSLGAECDLTWLSCPHFIAMIGT